MRCRVTSCHLYSQISVIAGMVEEYKVYVKMSDLCSLECAVKISVTLLSCNFCGQASFCSQLDLRHHLFMVHGVIQCHTENCHRLFNDIFTRDLHENMHHPRDRMGQVGHLA